ncbi:neutral/alkaline non-lysosomal ceramidase N-terminal domain-containing protein [Emticicia sp. BO119]|uniref:neutral/alkaline non-lysosomal ceramidase N-terminal domain-containing protein n=1 Tax=Emticicia sp. BO119 TaxID=2757768 RepID=UPI0015F051A4|nr:neutral/alkaline non-lysosomal ceramidase N-terminal domain-containing protein [Emticicia sp. BO119]MBA4851283.1 neutral/alkaline non-lysosomal ceramidase N-terminal domain-containing protein [Emticicia sp. BO119]
MKKLVKILTWFIGILAVIAITLLTFTDNKPLEETGYYTKTRSQLNKLRINGGFGTTLKAGWSKETINTNAETYIAGYGVRENPASALHDSIYVRAIVLDNGQQKVAMITMDLLIAPPLVSAQVITALAKLGFGREQLYFSATHTHSSAGGWAGGLAGRAIAGPRNDQMIQTIADAIIRSVKKASSSASVCKIGFQKINARDYITNRLFGESAIEDPYLRIMKIEKANKESALILTYAAHPTDIPKADNRISADYPGMLVSNLEKSGLYNFAAFFAGAVGSMRPADNGKDGYERAELIADNLANMIKSGSSSLKTDTTSLLRTIYFPLALHEPQLRLTKHIRLRPWVFNWLMGKQEVGINALRIGDMVWIGTPCDYSGMLYWSPDSVAEKMGKNLIITSFNGGYVGYITPDRYYDTPKMETQEMNWFGPYNGRYFGEVIDGLVWGVGR